MSIGWTNISTNVKLKGMPFLVWNAIAGCLEVGSDTIEVSMAEIKKRTALKEQEITSILKELGVSSLEDTPTTDYISLTGTPDKPLYRIKKEYAYAEK